MLFKEKRKNNNLDDSSYVVAYIVMAFLIGFGAVIGWIGAVWVYKP